MIAVVLAWFSEQVKTHVTFYKVMPIMLCSISCNAMLGLGLFVMFCYLLLVNVALSFMLFHATLRHT